MVDDGSADSEISTHSGSAGRLVADMLAYLAARLVLAAALTAVIFYGARAIGVDDFPLLVAMLFAIVIALPLGMWIFAPLRQRVTAGIAVVDERRRTEREQLQARLRGERGGPAAGAGDKAPPASAD